MKGKIAGKSIGVFDSGFGGLDILRGIIKELPEYNYIYLGDTARTPYGTRSKRTIYKFTEQAVSFLFKNNCELVVLACNTASSEALRKLQRSFLARYYPDKKVLGVLIPTAEEAIIKTNNKKIGVIATEGTVRSGAYVRELTKLNSVVQVYQKECPLLVPLVEAGEHNSRAGAIILQDYLKPLLKKRIDTLILGCTHYGILEKNIRKIVGRQMHIVSGSDVMPKKLVNYLKKHTELKKKLGKDKVMHFYSTDTTPRFVQLGSLFFKREISVRKAVLEEVL